MSVDMPLNKPFTAPCLLVMAGGTGGHIFPGLAVAEQLKNAGWHIHWLGTADRMEAQLVPEHGFDISFINISGLRHKNLLAWFKMPFKLLHSVWQAIKIVKAVQPDVVLGMGGYASAPGGVAARLLGKPLVLHEQNAAAGMSNRLLAKIATVVFSAFPNAFPQKTAERTTIEVVGNPLRRAISSQTVKKTDDKVATKNILVVGGSLGAQVLNEVMPKAFTTLAEQGFELWHQTGADKKTQVVAEYEQSKLNNKVKVTEFISDIASAYQWADLVICRAGALTVSELAMAGKPAIFVPLPHAVDDHQTKNAQYLVDQGAAKILQQNKLNSKTLTELVITLFAEEGRLTVMAKASLQAAKADASEIIAQRCKSLVKDKNKITAAEQQSKMKNDE